jgi:hypothetical protein
VIRIYCTSVPLVSSRMRSASAAGSMIMPSPVLSRARKFNRWHFVFISHSCSPQQDRGFGYQASDRVNAVRSARQLAILPTSSIIMIT